MSHAVYWPEAEATTEETAVFYNPRRLPGSGPSALTVSLAAAVVAMALSGSAIAWKWSQYAAVDTQELAHQSPQQVSLPPEDLADAQVIHGRLVVLTQPVYASVPASAVTVSAQVAAPDLIRTLEQPAPENAPETAPNPTIDELEDALSADPTVNADPVFDTETAPTADDSF